MRLLLSSALLVTSLFGLSHTLDLASLLEPDQVVDGTAKACDLTPELLNAALQPAAGSTRKFVFVSHTLPLDFAQRSAQLLAGHGFEVCRVPATLATQLTDEVVLVDERGRRIVFHGRRSPDTLYNFVQKHDAMLASVNTFQTITNKMEKKALDHIMEPKLVGYFPDIASPAWTLFQQFAAQLSAQMPVFVTHDAHMAAKFRLTAANQIVIIRRLEKSYVHLDLDAGMGVQPLTADEVIAWVNENRGLVIHELDDLNLYDPELRDPNKYIFVAIGDKAAPFGIYFHKALMKTIRNVTKENQLLETLNQQVEAANAGVDAAGVQVQAPVVLDDIEIVWIDSSKFPNAGKKFSAHFQIPITVTTSRIGRAVQFGLVQAPQMASLPVGQSLWFDVSQLFPTPNALEQKFNEEASIAALKNWILTMTGRMAAPPASQNIDLNLPLQEIVLEPEPVSVQAGASFILNCRTVNRAGKCQWEKDGMIVPVSSTGHFRLVNPEDPDDCSLSVTNANTARDNGAWTCRVTEGVVLGGQSVIPAVEAQAVEVLVTPAPTKKVKSVNNNKSQQKKQKKSKSKSASKSEL